MGPLLFKNCCEDENNKKEEKKYEDLVSSNIYDKITNKPYSEIH